MSEIDQNKFNAVFDACSIIANALDVAINKKLNNVEPIPPTDLDKLNKLVRICKIINKAIDLFANEAIVVKSSTHAIESTSKSAIIESTSKSVPSTEEPKLAPLTEEPKLAPLTEEPKLAPSTATTKQVKYFEKYDNPNQPFGYYKGTFEIDANGLPILTGKDIIWYALTPNNYYQGEMKNGYANGKGICIVAGNRYDGYWFNGKQSGYGIMQYANGDHYDGNWLKSNHCGYGTMKYANGDEFVGEWLLSFPYDGTMKYANGDEYVGQFLCGKKHGKGILKKASGQILSGPWRNDEMYKEMDLTGMF